MTKEEREKIKAEVAAELREDALKRRRAYKAEWRRKNPDKIKKSNERYYIKKAAQIMAEREGKENG